MAQVTFKIPVEPKRGRKWPEIKDAKGTIAYFQIGGRKIKFVLQHDQEGKPDALVHYASGYVFGRLNGPKLEHAVSRGTYTSLTDRGAAAILIARAVSNMGAEAVLARLDGVPVLNK